MTAKPAVRKSPKPKGPNVSHLKQQLAQARAQNDQLSEILKRFDERMEATSAQMATMAAQLEEAKKPRTSEEILSQHDRSAAMTRGVLGDDDEGNDYPEPPPSDQLPAHLVAAKRALAKAVNAGVSRTRVEMDAGNETIGQFEPRAMRSDGPASESLDPLSVADEGVLIDNRKYTPEKLEYETFMHEYLLVRLHDTTDETAIPIPQTTNSGHSQFFVRGQPQWVRRLSIEPLARAKKTTYTQELVGEGANKQYINIPHTALMYPFEVLKDSKRGKQWLRAILNEPY